jgi:hypothetical protein
MLMTMFFGGIGAMNHLAYSFPSAPEAMTPAR